MRHPSKILKASVPQNRAKNLANSYDVGGGLFTNFPPWAYPRGSEVLLHFHLCPCPQAASPPQCQARALLTPTQAETQWREGWSPALFHWGVGGIGIQEVPHLQQGVWP